MYINWSDRAPHTYAHIRIRWATVNASAGIKDHQIVRIQLRGKPKPKSSPCRWPPLPLATFRLLRGPLHRLVMQRAEMWIRCPTPLERQTESQLAEIKQQLTAVHSLIEFKSYRGYTAKKKMNFSSAETKHSFIRLGIFHFYIFISLFLLHELGNTGCFAFFSFSVWDIIYILIYCSFSQCSSE